MKKIVIPLLTILVITFLLFNKAHSQSNNLVLWNKLGSQAEVENSAVGANGVLSGGSFMPGVFGNAYVATYYEDLLLSFSTVPLPYPAGAIEFWAKLIDFPTGTSAGGRYPEFIVSNAINYCIFGWSGNDGHGGGGFTATIHNISTATNTFGWSTYAETLGPDQVGDWHHYALVWDGAGIPNASNHMIAIYLDGQLKSTYWHNESYFSEVGPGMDLLGQQGYLGGWGSVAIDNIKVWDYAKTDFSEIKTSPMHTKAAELAKKVIGADCTPGAMGWSYDNNSFLGPYKIKTQTYTQEQGGSPVSGLDNPGLVYWAYNTAYFYKYMTPHGSPIEEITPASLAANEFVRQITEAELLPGDVLFLDTDQDNTIDQTAIYTNDYTYSKTINGITYSGTYNVVIAKDQATGIIPERVADLKIQAGFQGFYRLAEPKQVDIYTNEYEYKKGEIIQAIVNVKNPENTDKTYILRVGLYFTGHNERLTRQEITVPAHSTLTITVTKGADWEFVDVSFGSLVAVLKEANTYIASDKANIKYMP